ncbi:hypothetical protein Scep_000535 [Stephania cephalantha]|uniref:Uncharacterized protein n=1 Tax=Stephania cephalantha TaxID=152367 RepID=A0AAP0LAF4_9MAGN
MFGEIFDRRRVVRCSGMDERANNNDHLVDRIQKLEHERDELRKDIEELCLQQGGSGYIGVVTRMHFQNPIRTAGLEQEIESLKKKLAACTRDNSNLQEELSEVYHIKSQLADLHSAEVSKNEQIEMQLKFFQGCVASAFAERDNALMEVEKLKEREETMARTSNESEEKLKELSSDLHEAKELCTSLQTDIVNLKEQNTNFEKVITKFYAIRKSPHEVIEDDLDSQCECLLQDDPELWSFDNHADPSTADYIIALEQELQTLRSHVDNLQSKFRMGLEIEHHLKKKVRKLEKREILLHNLVKIGISKLRDFHTEHRVEIVGLLEQEKAQFKSMHDLIGERVKQFVEKRLYACDLLQTDVKVDDIECRDVHITMDSNSGAVLEEKAPASPKIIAGEYDASDSLAQALHEKVAALLLLSQQEERHLLDRNLNVALQKKIEELQRNLRQVTNEKVKALMELARLRYVCVSTLCLENMHVVVLIISLDPVIGSIVHGMKHRTSADEKGERSNPAPAIERGGKLKSLLKKTRLSNLISGLDYSGNEDHAHLSNYDDDGTSIKPKYPVDFARLRIENATFKESIESLEHLTTTIHRLRLSLTKARDAETSPDEVGSITEALEEVIDEAKLVKTALGSSLPVSWSAEAESGLFNESLINETIDDCGDSGSEKLDSVTAAGFEMVELITLAAQILKERITEEDTGDGS